MNGYNSKVPMAFLNHSAKVTIDSEKDESASKIDIKQLKEERQRRVEEILERQKRSKLYREALES
jgi:hypothetical protein